MTLRGRGLIFACVCLSLVIHVALFALFAPAAVRSDRREFQPPAVRVSFEKSRMPRARVPHLLAHIDAASHEEIVSGSMPIVAAPRRGGKRAAPMRVILKPERKAGVRSRPSIYQIEFSTARFEVNVPIHVRVWVSNDVNGVYARVAGRFELGIPPAGSGTFGAGDDLPFVPYGIFERDYTLPEIPGALRGRVYTVEFIALTRDGAGASANVPVYVVR